jgi:hypothetical protein
LAWRSMKKGCGNTPHRVFHFLFDLTSIGRWCIQR